MSERGAQLHHARMSESAEQEPASERSGVYAFDDRTAVTLVVHAWSDVEPGTLAWSFPSVAAALRAAAALRNAAGWTVLEGRIEAAIARSPTSARVLASSA